MTTFHLLKHGFYRACRGSGYTRRAFKSFAAPCTILGYHRILAEERLPSFCPNTGIQLPLRLFEAQMKFLAERCRVLSLRECLDRLEAGEPFPPHSVVITFDDGYRSDYTLAYPILMRYGFSAAFFPVPAFVGDGAAAPWWHELQSALAGCALRGYRSPDGGRRWNLRSRAGRLSFYRFAEKRLVNMPSSEREAWMAQLRKDAAAPVAPAEALMLDWKSIRRMAEDPLVEFGAHTMRHVNLCRESREVARKEIFDSKACIEKQTQRDVTVFAYPYGHEGSFNGEIQEMVKAAGFRSAFIAVAGHVTGGESVDRYRLPRVIVDGLDNLAAFEAKLSGVFVRARRYARPFLPSY